MGDMRMASLVIGCGDSDLRARIAYYWSDDGGSNLLRVVNDQMDERHSRGQGTGRHQQKRFLLLHGHIGRGSTVTSF